MPGEKDEGGQTLFSLTKRAETSSGEVAYDVFGSGESSVVLVHGTPSRSQVWRGVIEELSDDFRVFVYDLPGFGESEKREGQDVSIAAQGRVLKELLGIWGLDGSHPPMVAGHDIGGGTVLRSYLEEGARFSKIALLDSVVLTPWGTPTLKHVQAHMDAYRTMPGGPFRAIVASHLRTATVRPIEEEVFGLYLSQWSGEEGQAAYLRKDAQLSEGDTEALEPLLSEIDVPVQIVWGEKDAWLDPSAAHRLADLIPRAKLDFVAEAGHFVMEDAPQSVSETLRRFFTDDPKHD